MTSFVLAEMPRFHCEPPPRSRPSSTASAVLRAWRGEIGLYRAAYGLGGLGLALASLLGDAVSEAGASAGGAGGWISWVVVSAGELLLVWVAAVAAWRSARRGRLDGRRYGPIAVGFALTFVGIQLALTIGWTGWTALAGFGLAPEPAAFALHRLIQYAAPGFPGLRGRKPSTRVGGYPMDRQRPLDDARRVARAVRDEGDENERTFGGLLANFDDHAASGNPRPSKVIPAGRTTGTRWFSDG